jgi:hypothetical protein
MTPRAMCRIIFVAFLLLGPLLTEWFSPAQVWGADWYRVTAATTGDKVTGGLETVLNTPAGSCNYNRTIISGTDYREGIWGSVFIGNTGTPFPGAKVELFNADTGQNLGYTIANSELGEPPQFIFPESGRGLEYTGPANIPDDLVFKLRFSDPNNIRPPIYYPDSPTYDGAARLSFNASCYMVDLDNGTVIGGSSASGASQPLYGPGSVAGRVFVRNSGNPITTGVPISLTQAQIFQPLAGSPDTPDLASGPVAYDVTNNHGNFVIDYYSIPSTVTDGTRLFVRFVKTEYISNWYTTYNPSSNVVDERTTPYTLSALDKTRLVQVVLTNTAYSTNYYPPGQQQNGTYIVGQMIANNKISGTISGPGGPAAGAYAEAYVSGVLAGTSNVTGLDGIYTIPELAPFVTYTVKFIPKIGSPYLWEWHTDTRVPGSATPHYTSTVNATIPNVNGVLNAGTTLQGNVQGQGGGLEDVEISVYDATKPYTLSTPISQIVLPAAGSFSFQGMLDTGTYKVYFRPLGTTPLHIAGWYTSIGGTATADPNLAGVIDRTGVSDPYNGNFNMGNITLPLGNVIKGTIYATPSSSPAFGGNQVKVTVLSGTVQIQEFFVSDSDNAVEYNTAPLPDGSYKLLFTPPSPQGIQAGWIGGYYSSSAQYNRTSDISQATTLNIFGSTVSPIDVTLPVGASLLVTVTTKDTQGNQQIYGGVEVRVVDITKPQPYPTIINGFTGSGDGAVRFNGLVPQNVGVYVLPPGNGAPEFLSPVNLTAGSIVTRSVEVTRAAYITGILEADNDPLFNFGTTTNPNVIIQAFRTDNKAEVPLYLTSLSPTGQGNFSYIAKLAGGSYYIKFTALNATPAYLPLWYAQKYNRDSSNTITANPDNTLSHAVTKSCAKEKGRGELKR